MNILRTIVLAISITSLSAHAQIQLPSWGPTKPVERVNHKDGKTVVEVSIRHNGSNLHFLACEEAQLQDPKKVMDSFQKNIDNFQTSFVELDKTLAEKISRKLLTVESSNEPQKFTLALFEVVKLLPDLPPTYYAIYADPKATSGCFYAQLYRGESAIHLIYSRREGGEVKEGHAIMPLGADPVDPITGQKLRQAEKQP